MNFATIRETLKVQFQSDSCIHSGMCPRVLINNTLDLAQGILHLSTFSLLPGFPSGLAVKNLPSNAGDTDSIPGLGRSPGEANGNPLQYSCLENPMDIDRSLDIEAVVHIYGGILLSHKKECI